MGIRYFVASDFCEDHVISNNYQLEDRELYFKVHAHICIYVHNIISHHTFGIIVSW